MQLAKGTILSLFIFYLMLEVPLDSRKVRKNSFSQCADDSFDPRKLSVTVDQQKRVIRKLKLKVSKLEETLKKERRQLHPDKGSATLLASINPQNQVLREEMEKSNLLEEVINRLGDQIVDLLGFAPEESCKKHKTELPTVPSFRSLPQLQMALSGYQQNSLEYEVFYKAQRTLNNMSRLVETIQKQKEQVFWMKKQNKKMTVEAIKFSSQKKTFEFQLDELKEFKNMYQTERKHCIKLKSLLEKSQYERNNMLTQIHRMPSKEKEVKTTEEWISISKSLNCRILHLEREKKDIIEENLKEKEKWNNKYKQFLKTMRQFKQRGESPSPQRRRF